MKLILSITLPGVLAQTLGSQPLTLYNGGNLLYPNCGTKTNACDCHYASCSLTGDCACGWDDSTRTCQAGVVTKCVSCPAMRRCSVAEKLIIGPDGFPVPGQLSVWGGVPYPDGSGVIGQGSSSIQGSSSQVSSQTSGRLPSGQMSMSGQMGQMGQGQMGQMGQGQMSGQMSGQSYSNQPAYSSQPTYTYSSQPTYSTQSSLQSSGQVSGQSFSQSYAGQSSGQAPQYFGQLSAGSTSAQQVFGQPISLYRDTPLSASGCAAKQNACDCHYASCTPAGDCLCGWDASTQTCRAGIPTQCVSCPSMGRCAIHESLLIGPDGFPVPGQLSVWGNVPYPDQVNQTSAPGFSGQQQFTQFSSSSSGPQISQISTTSYQQITQGKAAGKGKAGKAARNQTRVGM